MSLIKYRIYDPHTKSFKYSGATPMMLSSFFRATAVLNVKDKQMYEQFIGLQDINKVDFYGGDIIYFEDYYNKKGIIEYSSPQFGLFDGKDGFCSEYCWEDWGQFEIIGNIHENLELLGEF